MENLSDRDLALLHAKFVVPMVVGDILRGDELLDETSEYVLNIVIGDLKADTALLCIALCGQRVGAHCDHLPVAKMLRMESDRIVDEYGRMWLDKDNGRATVNGDIMMEILNDLPEDLEGMAHLLDATLAEMPHSISAPARLCDLLALQAHEHMDMAEAQLQTMKARKKPRITRKTPVTAEGNIVHFPARRNS